MEIFWNPDSDRQRGAWPKSSSSRNRKESVCAITAVWFLITSEDVDFENELALTDTLTDSLDLLVVTVRRLLIYIDNIHLAN